MSAQPTEYIVYAARIGGFGPDTGRVIVQSTTARETANQIKLAERLSGFQFSRTFPKDVVFPRSPVEAIEALRVKTRAMRDQLIEQAAELNQDLAILDAWSGSE